MWVTPPPNYAPETLLYTNGGYKIGLGHWVRSMALAQCLSRPVLVSATDHPFLKTSPVPVWIGDAPWCARLAVVDQYDHAQLVNRLTDTSDKVAVIVDGPYHNFQIDYVINGHVGADKQAYHIPGETLIGPQFAPLRPVFARKRRSRTMGDVHRILVCLGGGTAANSMLELLADAIRSTGNGIEVVLYGGTADLLPQFGAHKHVRDTGFLSTKGADAMLGADLAITTASMTALELLCLGVPCLTYCVAENQRIVQQGLLSEDVAEAFDGPRSMIAMLNDEPRRRDLSKRGMDLVDGKGCERIGARLCCR